MVNMSEQEIKTNDKKINLNITTPRGLKFEEKADMVIMRCVDGKLGVLPGHEPIKTALGDGTLQIINDGIERKLAVFGGIVEIKDNTVNIFSTIAQRLEEIDLERAKADLERAKAAIQEDIDKMQFENLRALMYRSLIRLEVGMHMEDVDYFDEGENGE